MENSEFIFSRHAKKITKETPESEMSEKYVGITKEGEQETLEKSKELAVMIDKLPEGAVAILSGISKVPRARGTMEAYADGLKKIFENRSDIFMVSSRNTEGSRKGLKESLTELKKVAEMKKEKAEEFAKKKMIVEFPLAIKHFTATPEEWDKWNKYFTEILEEKGENARDEEILEWISAKEGLSPDKTAGNLLYALKREEDFFRKFFPDEKLFYINVDHSGELDSLFTYLANGGIINREGFEKINGTEIKENELAQLGFLPSGEAEFKYRGQVFHCPAEIFENFKGKQYE